MSTATPEVSSAKTVIAIVGPTATGKSHIAELVAAAVGGEVVSADSMQVYRGMDIGTAKTPPERRTVPLHCVDLASPGEEFSAALFQRAARDAIDSVRSRSNTPVLTGGTGLYVSAALDDMHFPAGELDSATRRELEALAESIGAQAMHERLTAVDPDSAALIHPHNVRRTIRALEMADSGVSYAEQSAGLRKPVSFYDACFLGLTMKRAALYARIDARVDAMLDAGLLDEVRGLLDAGLRDALTATQAIGYKELVPVLDGLADLDEAVETIKRETRRYAKRQLTWFRRDSRVGWVDVTDLSPAQAAESLLGLIESGERPPYPDSEGF